MNQLIPNYVHLPHAEPIDQLNLTNSSFNALTRAGIRTVGELIQLVQSDGLQTIPALGRKSISEIKSKLAQVEILDDSEVEANTDAISYRNYVHLSHEDAIEELNLTPRSFNALTRASVQTVAEVLQLVESGGLRNVRGLGRKSISEIKDKLVQIKILNDSEVEPNTTVITAEEEVFLDSESRSLMIQDEILRRVVTWQSQLVSKQLSRGLLHEQAIIANRPIRDWLAQVEKVESNRIYEVLATVLTSSLNVCEEIEFLLSQTPQQYSMDVLLSTCGYEQKTLRQTGVELGISRQRVKQIRSEIKDKITSIISLKARPALLRMQSALLTAADLGLDITCEKWTLHICSSGLVGDWTSQDFVGTDTVQAMIAICNLLASCKISWLKMPLNLHYAVQLAMEGKPDVPAKFPHALETLPDEIKRLIDGHTKNSGGVYVKWLSLETGMELNATKDVLQILGYKSLSGNWFVPKVIANAHQIKHHDVFHRCLRKMFQYCGPLSIDDICSGLRHTLSRKHVVFSKQREFPVPPPDVMDGIVKIHDYKCEDGLYYWDGAYDEKLNAGETVIMNSLEQIGPVLHHNELSQAFLGSALSFPLLHATLNYSPLFDKIDRGLYRLRGSKVTYEDIERAEAAGEPRSLRPEVEYDIDGNIIVSVTLSTIAVASGTIFCGKFPNLSGDWHCYVHGQEVGELNATETEFRSLKKPLELLNCQPGNRLKFIFNTWERTITIENEGMDAEN